ncbi:polymorphic toxin-type HINT domain-containing protein [Planomonospora algeriensis]
MTRREFDALGRLTALIEPTSAEESITTTFGYDATGAQTRLTDGRGNATWTTYNSLGLIESVIEPATTAHPNAADRTWTQIYDAAGNNTTTLQPGGVRIDHAFDPLGRMIKQTGTGASVATPERTITYDASGQPLTIGDYGLTYNDRGLLTKLTKAGNQVAAYAYDARGNLTQRVDPTGTATYTWDDGNRLKTATDPVTGRTLTYDYDKADRLTSQSAANPATSQSYAYDALDRPTSQTVTGSTGSELAKIVYGWDKDDNLTTKTTSGTAGAGTNTYGYDHAGRLTSWTGPGGKTVDYAWDKAGNRTKSDGKTFVYDERNRLLSGGSSDYTYTPRGTLATETTGGQTKNLVFDAFDRLITDGETTYGYDALGRIASRTKGGDQQRFVYSGMTNDIAAITDGTGGVQAKYGRDPFGELLSLAEGGDPALAIMSDLHGDVVATFSGTALVDSTAYDPFGEVIQQSGTKRAVGYQGEYTDPDTGKVNMDARWYQPGTGTFASRDTATLSPDPSVQANRYTYGNASPLANADPSGHEAIQTWGGASSGGSGGSGWEAYDTDYLDLSGYMDARRMGWDTPIYECSGLECLYTWEQPPGDLVYNPHGSEKQVLAQLAWWEERFGDYANLPQFNDEEAKKWGLLPNGRPMPKLMKYEFWDAPEEVQQKFLVMYNVKQFYSTSKGDAAISVYWRSIYTPPPPLAFRSAAHPPPGGGWPNREAQLRAECENKGYSKKQCGAWIKAAAFAEQANFFKNNCLTEAGVREKWGRCLSAQTLLGISKEYWSNQIVENFKQTNLYQVLDFFVGDAVACLDGSVGSCALMALDAGGKGISKAVKALGKWAPGAAKAFQKAIDACKNSFIPGTEVLMADGSRKPIENVKVGDRVIATDPETGVTGPRTVTALIEGEGTKNLVQITMGAQHVGNDIIATDNHPFWVPALGEWVTAGRLQPGMWLLTSAGTHVQITAIKTWAIHQRVHNLTVDDLHTYHVLAGATPVLVHNSSGCRLTMSSAISKDPTLVKAAQQAGKNQKVQADLDSLYQQLSRGNMNPGLGSKALSGTDVTYARGRNGGRLFFRNVDGGIQIVGKSDKANESKVIARLKQLYGQ